MSAEHGMSPGQGGSQPDLYEVLGVDREATPEQVAQAWRRRARAEHPDSRPHDAAAPARFRALAEAYHVLADPGRRAAYDRASGYQPRPGAAAPGPTPGPTAAGPGRGSGGRASATPVPGATGAWLRAGPVWIESASQAPEPGSLLDEDAVLTQMLLRYLSRWGRAW